MGNSAVFNFDCRPELFFGADYDLARGDCGEHEEIRRLYSGNEAGQRDEEAVGPCRIQNFYDQLAVFCDSFGDTAVGAICTEGAVATLHDAAQFHDFDLD